jgi:hypothetical protein
MNIEDLKNDGKSVKPFIPTVSVGEAISQESAAEEDNYIPHHLSKSEDPDQKYKNKGSVLSMTSGRPTHSSVGERVKINIGDIAPEKKEENTNARDALVKNILGPGGEFESYVNNQVKEEKEWLASKQKEQQLKKEEEKKQQEQEAQDEEDELETTDEDEFEDDSSDIKEPEQKEIDVLGTNNESEEDNSMSEPTVDVLEGFELDSPEKEEKETDVNVTAEDAENAVAGYEDETNEISENPAPPKAIKIDKIEYSEPEDEVDVSSVKETISTTSDDEDELEEDEVEETKTEDNKTDEEKAQEDKERLETLKSIVTAKIKPVSKKLDLSTFKIASKENMSATVVSEKEASVAKWTLLASGVVVKIKEISGSNLEKIRNNLRNSDIRGASTRE